jgi:hypothetical protein
VNDYSGKVATPGTWCLHSMQNEAKHSEKINSRDIECVDLVQSLSYVVASGTIRVFTLLKSFG